MAMVHSQSMFLAQALTLMYYVSWGVYLCLPNIEQRQTGETIHSFQAQLGEPVSLLGLGIACRHVGDNSQKLYY